MGIYIDKPQLWPGALAARLGPSCHLVTDGDSTELAVFAKRIGLRASWLQHAGTWREHYDIFGQRIERAIRAGAVVIDRKGFVRILRMKKAALSSHAVTDSTPQGLAPPVAGFKSPGGRIFVLGCGARDSGSDVWPILLDGQVAGQVFQDAGYGRTAAGDLRWRASTRELYWRKAADAPTGIGFDVAAFDTVPDVLLAWGRSADEILDWAAGKPVRSIYAKDGFFQRPSGAAS